MNIKKYIYYFKTHIIRFTTLLFTATILSFLLSCSPNKLTKISNPTNSSGNNNVKSTQTIAEDGTYTSKNDVALYIYKYKKLPHNFITKKEAEDLGWNNSKNYVGDIAKGKSIGGDVFKNYEKLLPIIDGRTYYECDIDYKGKKRNAKRIIYADDFDEDIGFIYYTEDHYKTFEKLY